MKKYISGIYMWESPSGKKYIGQTKNLSFRKKQFLSKSNVYSKKNTKIDAARRKYPDFTQWKYKVLSYCKEEDLDEKEIYWINYYDTYNRGYNMTTGGGGTPNRHPTEAEIENNRQKHLGMTAWNKGIEFEAIFKPVLQYSLDGCFLNYFSSIKEASLHTGCSRSRIGGCVHGLNKSTHGFRWKLYEGTIPLFIDEYVECDRKEAAKKAKETRKEKGYSMVGENNPFYGKKHSTSTLDKIRQTMILKGRMKKVKQYTLDGQLVKEYQSISDAVKINHYKSNSTINECCKGKRKTAYGYKWSYAA